MLRRWQDHPHGLEVVYDLTVRLLQPFRRWLKPGGGMEWLLVLMEQVSKGAIFNCQMRGQCVLHSTGMTCPMNCPKNLRNGPCGGVRTNGHCEVIPSMSCVWVEAYERSQHMPIHGAGLHNVIPPLNRQLQGSSAWINEVAAVGSQALTAWSASSQSSVQE